MLLQQLLPLYSILDKSQMNHCQIEVKEYGMERNGLGDENGDSNKILKIKARKLYPQIECLHVCIGYKLPFCIRKIDK